jgi:hypothetical protein
VKIGGKWLKGVAVDGWNGALFISLDDGNPDLINSFIVPLLR